MYPNPQDAAPLIPGAAADHYGQIARELAEACRSGVDAIRAWAARRLAPDDDGRARRITDFARDRMMPADCAITEAQHVIARVHGFAAWSRLVTHLEALATDSDTAAFERAADAIVTGEQDEVDRLLAARPALVHARSDREHRSTLLHYVSANGVESYRQKTPANIVTIARRLLDAGAEVDAEADVYGGGLTTLVLVVTSAHPRSAGVQNALADLLLDLGARMAKGIVRDCLMNGCPEAAAHMVERGASLNLVEAAGLGRMDVLSHYLDIPGTAADADAGAALRMASWFNQLSALTFLLDHGVDVGARDPKSGETALHIAAYCGRPSLVERLLTRGAPVNIIDSVYRTPPLVWALHAWLVEQRGNADDYRSTLRMLADAGAEVKTEWIDDDRIRADPDLLAILTRRVSGSKDPPPQP